MSRTDETKQMSVHLLRATDTIDIKNRRNRLDQLSIPSIISLDCSIRASFMNLRLAGLLEFVRSQCHAALTHRWPFGSISWSGDAELS